MKYQPHEYQSFVTKYIKDHKIAALFLDCGLGKTVITLTAIKELMQEGEDIGRVLVIAPLRVAKTTWAEEIGKWDHLKGLRLSVAVGTEAERLAAFGRDADIYVTNRESLPWLVMKSGVKPDFGMLVIDELSSFKNWSAKRSKALMALRPWAKRVVGLTGTPGSNGLMDLFGEFKVMDMGQRLERFIGRYRDKYFLPDKRNGMVIYSYKPQPDAEERIYKAISDITISMRAEDHLRMPELVSGEVCVTLDAKERRAYDRLKQDMVLQLDGGEVTAANAAALGQKLAQMANGAVYGDDGKAVNVHCGKLDALEEIVEAANGRPVLVAYWYKHDLERILWRLDDSAETIDSAASIARWNRGEIKVGLIHPAAAGHGLNLQAGGSHLVWFSVPWSLELYQQTNARLYRQGQKAGTVVVQHLVAKGTVDESILKALRAKDMTQTALIEAVKAQIKEAGA